MNDKNEIIHTVEAALFSAERPLGIRDLQTLFPGQASRERADEIRSSLEQLRSHYSDRGVELVEVAGGFRFQTRAPYASALRTLRESRPPRYSRALLEPLAIIAYRQPVTRGDIEDIRGVTVTTEIMRSLLDREWVRQSGTREVPGHPALYVTTSAFLEYFGLPSLTSLPNLEDERELADIARELGIEMPAPIATPVGDPGEDGDPDSELSGPDPDATADQASVEESPETDRAQLPVETETEAASAKPIGDPGEEDPISRVASSHEID
ncbi:MAG: SMC-Scp complex subunit ScpB [Acidiferrobacteraceae bacterium]|nr:SMC-Scp complex subunit ScpB [Acidiferrobacteraceae bacterium]